MIFFFPSLGFSSVLCSIFVYLRAYACVCVCLTAHTRLYSCFGALVAADFFLLLVVALLGFVSPCCPAFVPRRAM